MAQKEFAVVYRWPVDPAHEAYFREDGSGSRKTISPTTAPRVRSGNRCLTYGGDGWKADSLSAASQAPAEARMRGAAASYGRLTAWKRGLYRSAFGTTSFQKSWPFQLIETSSLPASSPVSLCSG